MGISMDAILLLRSFYALAAGTVIFVNAIPALRDRFVVYGARAVVTEDSKEAGTEAEKAEKTAARDKHPETNSSQLTQSLDYLATWTVPHSYFDHFYTFSVYSSLFWATQLPINGPFVRLLSYGMDDTRLETSMSAGQILLCWVLMMLQGQRRSYECRNPPKPASASRMWVVHWVLGLAFYFAIGISIWIEGIPSIRAADRNTLLSLVRPAPSLRTFIGVPIFILASGIQHDCHNYLASLKKYTLPEHPAFQHIICPHYLAECVIYLTLSVLAAPKGELVNKTVFMGFVFVAANLGVTAGNSKAWYIRKFGSEKVAMRWKMVPFIY